MPETSPIAARLKVTVSPWSGATINGCFALMVSVPVEPEGEEVLEVVELAVEPEAEVDVVDEEATIGIST